LDSLCAGVAPNIGHDERSNLNEAGRISPTLHWEVLFFSIMAADVSRAASGCR
jgi:hypothetical protein